MNQSKDNPNEEWRNIFEKASETPPPKIWDAIERHLDEQNRAPLAAPWWSKPKAWLAAASVLLVLGVGAALFLKNNVAQISGNQISHIEPKDPDEILKTESATTVESGTGEITETPSIPGQPVIAKKEEQKISKVPSSQVASTSHGLRNNPSGISRASDSQKRKNQDQLSESTIEIAKNSEVSRPFVRDEPAVIQAEKLNLTLANTELAMIEPAEVQELATYWQTRYVFFNPDSKQNLEEPMPKPDASQLWAGLSMMPGGFNPNMQFSHRNVYQMNTALGNAGQYSADMANFSSSNRAVTGNRDKPKISYQAAAQMGWNLSKNWSLESGVAFLQGNSTSRSPGFYMDRSSQQSADLLPNAMVSGSANYSRETVNKLQLDAANANSPAVYVPMDKNMKNSYSFFQVPAYVGYTFRPEKKFSYTVLGGGVTNFFMENNLETTSGYTLKTTPENNVYNNVGFAAAGGLRVNYRLNNAWNTNLTANYQQALMSSFKNNLFLKSYPQIYGVSWGVRYTFQH